MTTHDDLRWRDVGPAGDWEDGDCQTVHLGARRIAVIRWQGRFSALKDVCPHRGLPMAADGCLRAGRLVCPHHGWAFDLQTGEGPDGSRVSTWPVRVNGGRVEIGT